MNRYIVKTDIGVFDDIWAYCSQDAVLKVYDLTNGKAWKMTATIAEKGDDENE